MAWVRQKFTCRLLEQAGGTMLTATQDGRTMRVLYALDGRQHHLEQDNACAETWDRAFMTCVLNHVQDRDRRLRLALWAAREGVEPYRKAWRGDTTCKSWIPNKTDV